MAIDCGPSRKVDAIALTFRSLPRTSVADASRPASAIPSHGARNGAEHPFAKESRELLQTLENSRSHIVYSTFAGRLPSSNNCARD